MAVLKESSIRRRARQRAHREGLSVGEALRRVARQRERHYDIFLSQTIRDAEVVLGVYDLLVEMGYAVFCDWVEAHDAGRAEVTPANAAVIRGVMAKSDSLLFLDTEKADQSLWMCWELGWFDGAKGHVAVLPVLPEGQNYYRGREFLGLYPYVEIDQEGRLKVVRPPVTYRHGVTLFEAPNSRSFKRWRETEPDLMRPR